jgi:outer membrane lipoprotein LolB
MFALACSQLLPEARGVRGAVLIGALLLVSGCVTTRTGEPLPPMDSWETRMLVLGSQSHWEFSGRVAVKAGEEGFNGKINWSQQGDAFETTVAGPLGVGAVRIQGEGRSVMLTDKDGVQTVLQDAESELQWRYGWTIPVHSLRYWALGIPDPSVPAATVLDEQGRLQNLEQGHWRVEISTYRDSSGQSMPRILTATNPDTRVRMVIDSWLFFDR